MGPRVPEAREERGLRLGVGRGAPDRGLCSEMVRERPEPCDERGQGVSDAVALSARHFLRASQQPCEVGPVSALIL